MHTILIDYVDYINDNKPSTEELAFNINAFELAEIAANFEEDLGEYMSKAFGPGGNYKDGFKVLKMLFVAGYGRRKMDLEAGKKRFYKNPGWLAELLPSPEFEAFYLKLTDDATFAAAFWNGLVSAELLARANKIQAVEDVKPVEGKGDTKFRDLPVHEQAELMRLRAQLATKQPAEQV